MTIGLLAAAGLAVVLGLWLLVTRARRRQGSTPIVLAAMPLALLMLVTPIPLVALWTIDAFTAAGQAGTTTTSSAARLASGMTNPLWWGSVGFLLTLIAAAVLQRLELQRVERVMTETPAEQGEARWWASVMPVASVLLVIPAAFLLFRQAELATFLMQAADLIQNPKATSVAGMPLAEFSRMMSARLVVGVLGGFALLALVVMSAVVNIISFRSSAHSEGQVVLSHGVLIFTGVFGLWTCYVLMVNARAFARVVE